MFSKSTFALVLAIAPFVFVNAQTETTSSAAPAGTEGLTECILTCVSTAASSAGCSSFADLSCVCTSSDFQTQARTCLESSCTAEELQTALALQDSQCAAVTGASSVFSSISSEASSFQSSLSSAQASFHSSLASEFTGTGTGTGTSTGTRADSTGTGTDTATTDAGYKVTIAPGAVLGAAVGILGLVAGALVV